MEKTKWSDYGESSLTILSVIVGIIKERPRVPYDPSDFERCVHLFECLEYTEHEIKCIMNKVAIVYPIWEDFVKEWNTLMQLYNEEKSEETAPKLYDHLQKCRGKLS